MDRTLTHWINAAAGSSSVLDAAMLATTRFGIPIIVLCVVLQWWSKDDRVHIRHTSIAAGLAFLIGLAFNQAILLFIQRVRPYDAGISNLIIERSGDWSFPSDHATASFAIAATFALHALRRRAILFLLMSLLIAYSRIFVGTHYLSDILGGALTGIVAAVLVRWSYHEGSRLDRFATGIL